MNERKDSLNNDDDDSRFIKVHGEKLKSLITCHWSRVASKEMVEF